MSGSRVHFPPNRLGAVISNKHPEAIRDCIAQAGLRLEAISGACAAHVDQALAEIERNLLRWPERADAGYIASLYEPCVSIIGSATVAGSPGLDEAAKSLCDVLDSLGTGQTWERAPVEVHIAAMRLLQRDTTAAADAAQILRGLQQVRLKCAPR